MNSANALPAEPFDGIYIEQHELEIVHDILQRCIPERKVWAFGSRATGARLKRFSDLDLAIEGKLTLAERARLADEFDESSLPFKVDIVELDEVEEDFRQRVQRDSIEINPSRID
jgi:predicted nucleotidyltransferase